MIRKLLLGIAALIVLLVVLVLAGPSLIDLRPRVEAMASAAMGREVRIEGPLKLSLVPEISVSASAIHVANAAGGGDFASLGGLSARVELLPLLGGRVVIDSLVLDRPKLALAVDQNGTPNWLFKPQGKAKPAGEAGAGGGSTTSGGGLPFALRSLELNGGEASYQNAATGQKLAARDITLAGGTIGHVVWRLAMVLNGEKVAGDFSLDSLEKLLAGQKAAIAMDLKTKYLTASYKGTSQRGPEPALDGTFDLDVPSMGELFAWLDQKLAYDPGPVRMHLETATDGGKLTLRNAALTGRAISATASAEVDTTKSPPSFTATVAIPNADIDAYLPPPPKPAPAQAAPPSSQQSQPQTQPGGWSTAPYDFSALGDVDGRLAISIGKLRYHGQTFSDGAFAFTLGKRVLRLTEGHIGLAGGTAQASFTLDATAKPAKFQLKADIKGLSVRPLLQAFAGTDRLGGILSATADLTTKGDNQREMIEALAGTGRLDLANGAVYGFDLQKSLREIGSLKLATGPNERTEFASLGGSYTITAGVLNNGDLRMVSPLVGVAGAGTVSLPPRALDYKLEVRLAPGAGIASVLSSVAIPVRINGPWAHPAVAADWSGIAAQAGVKALEGNIGKVAPELPKALPGVRLPLPGLFRR